MAVCNTFRPLNNETGTFLTFSQYMEDLTAWKVKDQFHKIIPSKFIAIDCKQENYNNSTLPKYIQEYFENACACFKNNTSLIKENWNPEYTKTLFWNMMFKHEESDNTDPTNSYNCGLIDIKDIKYVGDINLQSYNAVDGMGYSEIYCHIPNEAHSYLYSYSIDTLTSEYNISRENGDVIEGYQPYELEGWETLSLYETYNYSLGKSYEFSWDGNQVSTKLLDKSFNINMIVVLYDIWNDDQIVCKDIPMGIYLTGKIDTTTCKIQNHITKYVSNEDIYNSGTSYGLRICSRYVVSGDTDNYIVKEVTVEDNNYGDLSRVLSQLSISQNKMDEVINKTYNTEQNYKNLLAIFKNSRTNVPYIKIVNNESCWFVNGKLIGPSVVDGVYDSYTNDEIDYLMDSKLNQSFQIIATAQNMEGKYIFLKNNSQDIILKWDVYYEGKKVKPKYVGISTDGQTFTDYTNTNQIVMSDVTTTKNYTFKAEYGQLVSQSTVTVYFVNPVFFGEIPLKSFGNIEKDIHDHSYLESLNDDMVKALQKYTTNNSQGNYEITTNQNDPGHICYAYPVELGELRYIIDMNGYMYYDSGKSDDDIANSFIHKQITIQNPLDDEAERVEYHVYINKEPSYVYKQILKFKKQVAVDEVNDYLN